MLSFPLPLVPVFKTLRAAQHQNSSEVKHAVQRTLVVILCGAVAFALPDFGGVLITSLELKLEVDISVQILR